MNTNMFSFFYRKRFNDCWGNKISIDTDGSIKPCLWSKDSLGNIMEDNIKSMVISGKLDSYWFLTKDKIETCCECEYRYACSSCGVLSVNMSGSMTAHPPNCNYNPKEGIWKSK